MSNDEEKGRVVSLSGQPIYRHGAEAAWAPPQGEMCLEQISAHVAAHLGKVETVLHEILSDTVHIDVHIVLPTEAFPYVRLVTSGMSDLPMAVPPEAADAPKYVELVVTLPRGWKLDQESFKDESWYWPVRLIKSLARLPHKHSTWLGWGHSVPNGDPAEPYAPNTKLAGAIILPSITVPDEFHTLTIDPEKEIRFYAVVPLYPDEMELKLRSGTGALLKKFGKTNITDAVSPARTNVGRKLFGLF